MIKKLTLLFSLIFSLFVLTRPSYAAIEAIEFFNSNIRVNEGGSLTVTETITYTFPTDRHGIFRNIPTVLTNQEGKKYKTPISVENVTDLFGTPYMFTTTESNGMLSIKIGDPNTKISGTKIYKITYDIRGIIEYFSDHDEIYWNVTGNGWEVPIRRVEAKIEFPTRIPTSETKATCYTGSFGSTETDCAHTIHSGVATYAATRSFDTNEGLTIVFAFPKGYITPQPREEYKSYEWVYALLAFFWYIIVPGLVLIIYFLFGRDPKINTAIPTLFDNPSDGTRRITPGEAGTLLDESADNQDITATMVDLAIRGYIKITEVQKENLGKVVETVMPFLTQKDFHIEKVKDYAADKLEKHETLLLNALFKGRNDVFTNELKDKFADDSTRIKDAIYKETVEYGYFPHNPLSIRTFWYVIGAIAIFTINIPFGIMSVLMAKAMPRKTVKGARTKVDVLGLKKFLSSQERQLEFQEANWYLFEKLLPYAIAFKVTDTWAKRFEHLSQEQYNPTWYSGSHGYFSANAFSSSMNALGTSVTNISTPTRSSSGFSSGFSGGSSGGGGGGGGGGSW